MNNKIEQKIMNMLLDFSILKFENEMQSLNTVTNYSNNRLFKNEDQEVKKILEILSFINKNISLLNNQYCTSLTKSEIIEHLKKLYNQTNDVQIHQTISKIINEINSLKNIKDESFEYYLKQFNQYFNNRVNNLQTGIKFIENVIYELKEEDIYLIFKYLFSENRCILFEYMAFCVNRNVENKLINISKTLIIKYPCLKNIKLNYIEKDVIVEKANLKFIKMLVENQIFKFYKDDLYSSFNTSLRLREYDLCLYICEQIGISKNDSDFIIENLLKEYAFDRKNIKTLLTSIINSDSFQSINKDCLEKIEYYVSKNDFGYYNETIEVYNDTDVIDILKDTKEYLLELNLEGYEDSNIVLENLEIAIELAEAENYENIHKQTIEYEQEYKKITREQSISKMKFVDELFVSLIPKTPQKLQNQLLELYDKLTIGNLQSQREQTLSTLNKILIKKNKKIGES